MGTTKQALIEQITEVFRLHGFAGATLAQLSAATGLKRASLYHHFPGGKADMANEALIAALTEMNDLALTRLAGPQGASLRLDGFIEGFSRYALGGRRGCVIVALALTADAPTRVRVHLEMTRWSGLLAALFAFGRSDGEAHFLAESLLADLYGALLLARLRDNATGFGERLAGIAQRYRGHLDQRQSAW